MLRNHLTIGWRNIIKAAGLSAGIPFTLLIAAYLWSELQVNGELKNINQYILQSKSRNPSEGYDIATMSPYSSSFVFGFLNRTTCPFLL